MMMDDNERTKKNIYPGLQFALPDDWRDLTTAGDKKSIIKPSKSTGSSNTEGSKIRITAAARANQYATKTAYDVMNLEAAKLRSLEGVEIFRRNRDGTLGLLAGEGVEIHLLGLTAEEDADL